MIGFSTRRGREADDVDGGERDEAEAPDDEGLPPPGEADVAVEAGERGGAPEAPRGEAGQGERAEAVAAARAQGEDGRAETQGLCLKLLKDERKEFLKKRRRNPHPSLQ